MVSIKCMYYGDSISTCWIQVLPLKASSPAALKWKNKQFILDQKDLKPELITYMPSKLFKHVANFTK